MAVRQSKSKSKSKSNKSLKSKKAARRANINLAIGLSVVGVAGYVGGQGIDKAISIAQPPAPRPYGRGAKRVRATAGGRGL